MTDTHHNLMKPLLPAVVAVALLSGCHVYRAYERPAEVATMADSLWQPSADTATIARLPWTMLFTDAALQRLIRMGLEHNTDLRTAGLRVEAAEAQLKACRQAYAPSLSFSADGNVSRNKGHQPDRSYTLALSAEWELDAAGRLLNARRGQQATVSEERAARRAVQTQLVATIAGSYYSLLMLDRQLDIARRTADTWADYLRSMQALKNAGQATELAVAQTEASKLSTDATVVTLQQQISETENSLKALIGVPLQGAIERSTLEAQQLPDTLTAGVPLDLLSRRPDVMQQESALAAAYYATNAARSAFYPSITLGGTAGWTDAAGAAITNPGQWLLQAVGSLVQPLFDRGRLRADLTVAKANQQIALLNFRQSLLDAGNDVNTALKQWQSARQRYRIDSQQSQSLQQALRSAELLMRYSSQNYLEVIAARQALLNAELNVATDRYDEIQGMINLYHALGGGAD